MNFYSQEWKDVCAEIDKRIAVLDVMLRGPLDAEKTASVRGQIKALLDLKSWHAAPVPEPEESFSL